MPAPGAELEIAEPEIADDAGLLEEAATADDDDVMAASGDVAAADDEPADEPGEPEELEVELQDAVATASATPARIAAPLWRPFMIGPFLMILNAGWNGFAEDDLTFTSSADQL